MANLENGSQALLLLARGTLILNGTAGRAVALTTVEINSHIILSLNTVGATPTTTAPYVSAITPGTGFSVKSGTASADDIYNYAVYVPQ
jgi:hypothetical protein